MDWQPIETAPKNGEVVLLFLNPAVNTSDCVGYSVPDKLQIVAGWATDTWRDMVEWNCGLCEEGSADTEGYSSPFQITLKPTHWMPLLPPPKAP